MSAEYKIGKGKPPQGWTKGVSGNPGGAVKGYVKVSNALHKILRTAPDEVYVPKNKADVLALALYEAALKGDTWAAREILDRTEGKVSQQLAISAQQLPTSELAELLVEAFTEEGADELLSQRILLRLAKGNDE